MRDFPFSRALPVTLLRDAGGGVGLPRVLAGWHCGDRKKSVRLGQLDRYNKRREYPK